MSASKLGNLPSEGQTVTAGDYEFEVVEMNGRVIDKVRIRRAEATDLARPGAR